MSKQNLLLKKAIDISIYKTWPGPRQPVTYSAQSRLKSLLRLYAPDERASKKNLGNCLIHKIPQASKQGVANEKRRRRIWLKSINKAISYRPGSTGQLRATRVWWAKLFLPSEDCCRRPLWLAARTDSSGCDCRRGSRPLSLLLMDHS